MGKEGEQYAIHVTKDALSLESPSARKIRSLIAVLKSPSACWFDYVRRRAITFRPADSCSAPSPEPGLLGTTKVYSGMGPDIVMESLRSKCLEQSFDCSRLVKNICASGQRLCCGPYSGAFS